MGQKPAPPENSNARIVKKRRRRRKQEKSQMREGALHPDRERQRDEAKIRLSHKLNKKTLAGEIVVDDSAQRAREAAYSAKLEADRLERGRQKVERFKRKQRELLVVGARMSGGSNMKKGFALWRELRRRRSTVTMVEFSDAAKAVELLDLTQRDLRRLKHVFDAIDVDGSGHVDHEEFFEALNDDGGGFRRTLHSGLAQYLFDLIDLDGNGTLEFDELVHLCGTYAIFTRHEIARFVFDCFDEDGNEHLDEHEMQRLIMQLDNDPTFPGSVKAALEEFDSNGDGLIDWGEFQKIFFSYPTMFHAAFHMQNRIHHVTLGERRWLRLLERHARKQAACDFILRHHGDAPPLTCAQLLCSVVCCQSHHPAEKLLRIDTRSSGFADEEPNRSTRRYHACIRKYGFPTQDEPRKMKRRDDGCAEKDRQGPQVLGYAEWRVGAGERARQRAEAKKKALRESKGGSALRRASQQLFAAFRRASASMARVPVPNKTARVAVEL